MRKLFLVFAILIASMILMNCSEERGLKDTITNSVESKDVMNLEALALDVSKIVEFENEYIYEGDIVIRKSDFENCLGKSTQRKYYRTLTLSTAENIKIKIDPSISSWSNVIQECVNDYNNSNSKINMTIVTNSPDVIIYSDETSGIPQVFQNLPDNILGRAYLPHSSYSPGSIISINKDEGFFSSNSRKKSVLTHEIGHTVGFRHTDSDDGYHIDGTPESDDNSIMNTYANPDNNCLSYWDKRSSCVLYPTALDVNIDGPEILYGEPARTNSRELEYEAWGTWEVLPDGGTTLYNYQWYYKYSSGDWIKLNGQTNKTLTKKIIGYGTRYIKCVVNDGYQEENSVITIQLLSGIH